MYKRNILALIFSALLPLTSFAEPFRIILFGESGSGKSTFVRYLINTWKGAFEDKISFNDGNDDFGANFFERAQSVIHFRCRSAQPNFGNIFRISETTLNQNEGHEFLFRDFRNFVSTFENGELNQAEPEQALRSFGITRTVYRRFNGTTNLEFAARATESQTRGIIGYKFIVSSGPLRDQEVEIIDTPGLLDISSENNEQNSQVRRELEIETLISDFVEKENFNALIFLHRAGQNRERQEVYRRMMARYNLIFDLNISEKDEADTKFKNRLFFMMTGGNSDGFNIPFSQGDECTLCRADGKTYCENAITRRTRDFNLEIGKLMNERFSFIQNNLDNFKELHVLTHSFYYHIPYRENAEADNVKSVGKMMVEFYGLADKLMQILDEDPWTLSQQMREYRADREAVMEIMPNLFSSKNAWMQHKNQSLDFSTEMGRLSTKLLDLNARLNVDRSISSFTIAENSLTSQRANIEWPVNNDATTRMYIHKFNNEGRVVEEEIAENSRSFNFANFQVSGLIEDVEHNYNQYGELKPGSKKWTLRYRDGFELDIRVANGNFSNSLEFIRDDSKISSPIIPQGRSVTSEVKSLEKVDPTLTIREITRRVIDRKVEEGIEEITQDRIELERELGSIAHFLSANKQEYRQNYGQLRAAVQRIKGSEIIPFGIRDNPDALNAYLLNMLTNISQDSLANRQMNINIMEEKIKHRLRTVLEMENDGYHSDYEEEILSNEEN